MFSGGKIFVFTGILPILHDEEGMATCIAHEIAHVVARKYKKMSIICKVFTKDVLSGHGVEKYSKARVSRIAAAIAGFFTPSVTTVNLVTASMLYLLTFHLSSRLTSLPPLTVRNVCDSTSLLTQTRIRGGHYWVSAHIRIPTIAIGFVKEIDYLGCCYLLKLVMIPIGRLRFGRE